MQTAIKSRTKPKWVERDDQIIHRLQTHPCTSREFIDLFPTTDAAEQRLKRLVKKGKIKRVGFIGNPWGGRPRYLYSTRHIKVDTQLHEYELSRVLLSLNFPCIRGSEVDQRYLADAEVLNASGKVLYIEVDMNSMSAKQVMNERFPKYKECDRPVIWLVPTEGRLKALRERAESIKHIAWFGLLQDFIDSPFDTVLVDFEGNEMRLVNPKANSAP